MKNEFQIKKYKYYVCFENDEENNAHKKTDSHGGNEIKGKLKRYKNGDEYQSFISYEGSERREESIEDSDEERTIESDNKKK